MHKTQANFAEIERRLKPGQVIAKESFPSWWELHLRLVYWGIRTYQRKKWNRNWKAVHVFIVLPGEDGTGIRLFEQTHPAARFQQVEYLWDKSFAICEWRDNRLNVHAMVSEANNRVGMKYDLGDLLDFAFSGLILKVWRYTIRIWGDKSRRLGVCSTVVAQILKNAGECQTIHEPLACDPAYFEGNGQGWRVVARVRCGEIQEVSD